MSSQVAALQATINAGYGFAQAAVSRYGARDAAGSCQNANNAAAKYAQAKTDARAILKAAGSYADVSVLDLRAIDGNAAKAESEARDFYCKPITVAADFSPEIRAFMAMKAGLHLERGTVTPLTSTQALAGRGACSTDKIYTARQTGSAMANALNDGCQAFVLMYNMTLQRDACDTLARASILLGQVDPAYAAQAKMLTQSYGEVSRAFKCSSATLPATTWTSEGESSLKEVQPNLPPPFLSTKPYPARPPMPTR
jgi:hypothetical protein